VLGSEDVPQLVSAYRTRALPDHGAASGQVELVQEGLMWSGPGARPRRFTAMQHSAVDQVAFEWRARFRFARVVSLEVVDAYAGGEGSLEIFLLGRRLQQQRGPETSAGEALRYLAELPWVPQAICANRQLRWRAVDERHAEVHLEGEPGLRVTFEFDADGDIVSARSTARSLRRKGRWLNVPWKGVFSEYREVGGMRMPTLAEVSWELAEGPYVYWRGRISAARVLAAPFGLQR